MIPKAASAFSQITVASVALLSSSSSLNADSEAIIDALDNLVRSDLQQFSANLFTWVIWSAYAVAFGCVLEGPEIIFELWPHIFDLWTWNTHERRERFERRIKVAGLIGWLFVVLGVAAEGVFEGVQNRAEGQLQTFNDILLRDARFTSSRARTAALEAENASSRSQVIAKGAADEAATARREADSYAQEIASAKTGAADAISRLAGAQKDLADSKLQLADAVQRESSAEARLLAIKTPRSIVVTEDLIKSLAAFKGTKFTITSFQDDESLALTVPVDELLKSAGWIRNQPASVPLGFPMMSQVFEAGGKPENVLACLDTGIGMHVAEPLPTSEVLAIPPESRSPILRAAITLRNEIGKAVHPSDPKNTTSGVLDLYPAEEKLTICVGKKP